MRLSNIFVLCCRNCWIGKSFLHWWECFFLMKKILCKKNFMKKNLEINCLQNCVVTGLLCPQKLFCHVNCKKIFFSAIKILFKNGWASCNFSRHRENCYLREYLNNNEINSTFVSFNLILFFKQFPINSWHHLLT